MYNLRTRYHASVLVRILFCQPFNNRSRNLTDAVNLIVGEDIFCWPALGKLEVGAREWASKFLLRQFVRDNNLKLDCFCLWEILSVISRLEPDTQNLVFWYCSMLPEKTQHDYFPLTANPFPELFQLLDKPCLPKETSA